MAGEGNKTVLPDFLWQIGLESKDATENNFKQC